MLEIDESGEVTNPRVRNAISPRIERGAMPFVKGIIVHQTDSYTAQSTLSSYKNPNANGAHFLIDKDGTIYQTAPVFRRTHHVGKLISRCLNQMTCPPAELKTAKKWDPVGTHKRESKKEAPNRYPSNEGAIGIELVGKAYPNPSKKPPLIFELVTPEQNAALRWLVGELQETLDVPLSEVFRHPTVSHKTPSEAESALW